MPLCTRVYAWAGIVILLATTVFVVALAASELHRRAQAPPSWAECVAVKSGDECAVELLGSVGQ